MTDMADAVDRRIRRLSSDAHKEVLSGLLSRGAMATWGQRHSGVLYRTHGGAVGDVRLVAYSAPWERSDEPLCLRFKLGFGYVKVPRRALPQLGLEALRRCPEQHLELTVLPHEVNAFAAWLPTWIIAWDLSRIGKKVCPIRHPPTPAPMHESGEIRYYAWSEAAWAKYDVWRKARDERHAKVRAERDRRRELTRT